MKLTLWGEMNFIHKKLYYISYISLNNELQSIKLYLVISIRCNYNVWITS